MDDHREAGSKRRALSQRIDDALDHRAQRFVVRVSLMLLCALGISTPALSQPSAGIASLIVDLQSGETLRSEQPDVVSRAILPGSVAKVAAVAAALEAGIITPATRIVCTKRTNVDGHQLTCTHPDLHRGLTPADALTHSCNVFVASVSARLPRAALDGRFRDLGLPASAPSASVAASSLGLEGTRVTVRDLIGAVAKIEGSAPPPWKPETLDVLRAGLRGAVLRGTASAIGKAGIDAAAKTGTVDAGGVSRGVVIGVTPSDSPRIGFGLLVSGGAGMDAAALVVSRLQQAQSASGAGTSGSAKSRQPGSQRPSNRGVATANGKRIRVGVPGANGKYEVRDLPLDDYVSQVIAGEAQAGSEPGALDALAIAARTYTLANLGRHASQGFDLCTLTHCQVIRRATQEYTASARRTSGRYLVDRGKPAEIFYTASCGGHTERASVAWKGAIDRTYLPARRDPACEDGPQWRNELMPSDLLKALRAGGFRGDTIRGVSVTSRTESGRVAWLRVDGMSPPEISGDNLRTLVGRTIGWQHLRSTLFDVSRSGGGFVFAGRGAGHGVGLCVRGSAARARDGASAETILREYYPGLSIATLPAGTALSNPAESTRPRVVLPAADEPSRQSLQALVSSSVREVESALDTRVPDGLTLMFHPTVESYERDSGQRWFTAASARGTTIRFLPLNVLRDRGLLERTIRHELVHAATADSLSSADRWLAEGVAEWVERRRSSERSVNRPATAPGSSRATCPANEEFVAAASAESLRALYQRAGDCYERDIRAGRSWRTARGAR